MKFYDRVTEIERVEEFVKITGKKGSRILVITGRRRIGKTRLAIESLKNTNHLYFFTKKKRIPQLIEEWSQEIKRNLGNIFYGKFDTLEEFLLFLMEYSRNNPITYIFDEIQNLLFSDPSAFGTFQKIYDLNKETSNALLVFLGSSMSLMNKIFKNQKEPLFGRASDIMLLSYLPVAAQEQILKDHGLFSGENLLHLYSVFGGIPKYIEELVDIEADSFKDAFKRLFTTRDFFWEEGENLLKEEFGKEYSSYYSILSAVSRGRRRMNEIEQYSGIKDAGPYLKNLENIYNLTERRLPVTSKSSKERNNRYFIKDNFLAFWFRFIEPRKNLKELKQEDLAFEDIWTQLPVFEGRKLEDMLTRQIVEENPLNMRFSKAGKYWDRKGEVEIDALFIDEAGKQVYLFEVKRNKGKINRKQMEELRNKALGIPELNGFDIHMGKAYIEPSGLKMELDKKDDKKD